MIKSMISYCLDLKQTAVYNQSCLDKHRLIVFNDPYEIIRILHGLQGYIVRSSKTFVQKGDLIRSFKTK